jgi:hypothetical protein
VPPSRYRRKPQFFLELGFFFGVDFQEIVAIYPLDVILRKLINKPLDGKGKI